MDNGLREECLRVSSRLSINFKYIIVQVLRDPVVQLHACSPCFLLEWTNFAIRGKA